MLCIHAVQVRQALTFMINACFNVRLPLGLSIRVCIQLIINDSDLCKLVVEMHDILDIRVYMGWNTRCIPFLI